MTQDELNAIKEQAENSIEWIYCESDDGEKRWLKQANQEKAADFTSANNMRFIADARANILELAKEVERLQAALKKIVGRPGQFHQAHYPPYNEHEIMIEIASAALAAKE